LGAGEGLEEKGEREGKCAAGRGNRRSSAEAKDIGKGGAWGEYGR